MVETWQDSWFEEGTRLIYIVTSRSVDAILPLRVEPAPTHTVRVFVGRIELVTPAIRQSVEEALARGDRSTIDRYGRFLDPILKRIAAGNRARAHQIDQFRRTIDRANAAEQCQ